MVRQTGFIERRTLHVSLRDGTGVVIRPIVPEDAPRLADAFERLSERSRYRRFMGSVTKLTPALLEYLTRIDYVDHFAWVALTEDGQGLGVARYVRAKDDPTIAEAAVTVVDDYHGRGLGTLLLEALGAVALENGITHFRAYVLSSNAPMMDLLHSLGARTTIDSPGTVAADIDLPEHAEKLRGAPVYEVLRAAARGEVPILHDWDA